MTAPKWDLKKKMPFQSKEEPGTRAVEDEPADYFCLCQDKQDIQ